MIHNYFEIDLSMFMVLSTSEDNGFLFKKHLKKEIKNSISSFKKESHIMIKKSLSLIQFSYSAVKPKLEVIAPILT